MQRVNEILDELGALQAHYPGRPRSPEEHARWLSDYAADLKGCSVQAIRSACQQWRRSDATKFPTVGQLLPIARRLDDAKGNTSAEKPKAWQPISAGEYDSLTLKEKIRQHELMADRARTLAVVEGMKEQPMWDRNIHAAPQAWHTWMTRAAHHKAEAKLLREKLKEAELERARIEGAAA